MRKVLIADDSAFMRMMIRRIVEKDFIVVGEAENGIDCIEKYKECQPEIVTLDVTMPELDGLQTLKALLAIDPGAKVVMVSAMGQEAIVKNAISSGAASFIVKPFKGDFLLSVLGGIAPRQ